MHAFHQVFYSFMRAVIAPYFFLKGYRWQNYSPKSKNYLVLTNHNTNWDFFLFGLCLRRQMYYVASEHIFRLGFTSKIIRFLSDPIPRRKGASGDSAVELILERLKKGYNVCMMVEGNRSFTGETGWISPRNAQLVRQSGVGLLTMAIHGCYFVNPRWSKEVRRGPSSGGVVREYTPAEISRMTDEELTAAIRGDLHVDAYADQQRNPRRYRAKKPAETLETALFLCPDCGAVSTLCSEGDRLRCTGCGMELVFTDYGYFQRPDGTDPEYRTVRDWDRWQQEALRKLIGEAKENAPLFADRGLRLGRVEPGKGTTPLLTGTLTLYPEKLVISDGEKTEVFPIGEIQKLSVVLMDTILFTTPSGYFELKRGSAYNAVKYLAAVRLLQGKAFVS